MNRRTFLKRALGSFLAFIGVSGGTYYYAREIEPAMLQIHHEPISSANIPISFDGFKVIQFSDTHIGFHYTLDQLHELVTKINKLNPDLIVFTGDLVDKPDQYDWNERLIRELKSLKAPYGKYWVYGNHDHGGYGTDIVKQAMDSAEFTLLKNNHQVIEKNNERFLIAGIDDVILGKPDLKETLKNTNADLYTVLLAHEPDFADTASLFPVDLQLSGHSHGGQVRFPLLGHLYTPAYAEKYVQGKFAFENSPLTLFVNRGIGTTRLPYRFLCKPEIHVFTLKNSTSHK